MSKTTLADVITSTATPTTTAPAPQADAAAEALAAALDAAKSDFMKVVSLKVKRVGDETSLALNRTIVRYARIITQQPEPAASLAVKYDDGTTASYATAVARLLGVNGRTIKPVGFV